MVPTRSWAPASIEPCFSGCLYPCSSPSPAPFSLPPLVSRQQPWFHLPASPPPGLAAYPARFIQTTCRQRDLLFTAFVPWGLQTNFYMSSTFLSTSARSNVQLATTENTFKRKLGFFLKITIATETWSLPIFDIYS